MNPLKIAYKSKNKKKSDLDMEIVRALAEQFERNHFRRLEKKLKKTQPHERTSTPNANTNKTSA